MREILLIFTGASEADEQEAADSIQSEIFKVMEENAMYVRRFNSEAIDGSRLPPLMLPDWQPQELKIPEFMEAAKRPR